MKRIVDGGGAARVAILGPSRGIQGRFARLPLRWRLALGYGLILLLVLAPIAAVQAGAIRQRLLDDARTTLSASSSAEALSVGRAIGKPPRNGAAPTASDIVAGRPARPDTTEILVDATGRTLYTSGGLSAEQLVPPSTLRRALSTGQGAVDEISTSRGLYLVAVAPLPAAKPPRKGVAFAETPGGAHRSGVGAFPVVNGGPADPHGLADVQSPGGGPLAPASSREAIILARDLAPIATTARGLGLLTLGGTVLAIILATVLGAALVRRALRPLTRVAAAAEAMTAGDYARRVTVPPARDEVGDLAAAFNAMAAAVEDAFATQRRFVADAAHELRTPLTALGGYADVLLLGAASDPRELERALAAMGSEATRMTRLVNDLLALARLDVANTASPAMHWRDVDLSALLREARDGAALPRPERHITLDLPAGRVVVRGDPDRLRQVVDNLVDNAVKFTDTGGHIALALRTDRDAGAARLDVRDDGIGIAPDDLPHVCEPFYRADKSRGRATGGTGLGLAIVQAIVAAHGGCIDVQSASDEGTTVTVRLPLTPYPGAVQPGPE